MICTECNKNYSISNAARHRQTCNQPRKSCPYCNKRLNKLEEHLQKCHHRKRYQLKEDPHCHLAKSVEVSAILQKLQPLQTQHNSPIIKAIHQKRWHTLGTIPIEERDHWLEFTLIPQLIPAEQCWAQPAAATLEEFWLTAFYPRKHEKDYSSFQRGELPGDRGIALLQLTEPNPANQHMVLNMTPKSAPEFHIPDALRHCLRPNVDKPKLQINITPKYSFVDLHTDRGLDTVCITVDKCQKVWFLWPPTWHNLDEFEQLGRGEGRMVRCALDDGIIVYTDNTKAIFIPAGWIHATMTLSGGFLAGISFLAAESVMVTAKCLAMDLRLAPDDFEENCTNYLNGLNVALKARDATIAWQAVDSWTYIRPELQKLVDDHPGALAQAVSIWREFLPRSDGWQRCPCGWEGNSFKDHFSQDHLSFLQT
ncbi:MAG: hypothetical protein M1836_003544 [Candelina mexicana]|nr:MAG: hypothetical protein M1836_003544 [Candelina mexicana]